MSEHHADVNEWDPLVLALFVTLQEFECDWSVKQEALAAAGELCKTCFELAAELEQSGEVAMTPTGMVRLGG